MADCKEGPEDKNGPQSSIVMKVDSSGESSQHATEDTSESTSLNNSSDNDQNHGEIVKPQKFILRPSQLNAVTNNQTPSPKPLLQPAKFQNPFKKLEETSPEKPKEEEASTSKNTEEVTAAETSKKSGDAAVEKPEDAKPKFLPLVSNTTKDNESNNASVNNAVPPSTSTPTFVFGQNLKERVTVANDAETNDSEDKEGKKSEESNENGSSELLFSNAAALARTTSRPAGMTLSQAAQEMEEASRANKRKYSEVNFITGEEGETNILQIDCKLFAYDKATGSWQERGRGTLRLNDVEEESRLIGRTAGTQKVILNTKVWYGMTIEKASLKSLRLTAMDVNGEVRIFVVQAAPKEVEQLYNLLMQRLKRAQERNPKKQATDQ